MYQSTNNQRENVQNQSTQPGHYSHYNFSQVSTGINRVTSDLPNQFKKKEKNLSSVFNPKIIVFVVIIIIFVFGGLFSLLVPVYGQTLASRTMDAMGWHSLAMKMDAIHQQDKAMAALASIDVSNPEQCGQMWPYLDAFRPTRLEAMQFKNLTSVRPVNEKYASLFNFEAYLDARISLVEKKAWAEMELTGKLNSEQLTAILQEDGLLLSSSKSSEKIDNWQFLIIGQAYLDPNFGAFRVPQINLEAGKFLSTQNSLNSWYKQDFNFTSLQKQGIDDLIGLFGELSTAKISDVITEKTGRTILTNYCKLIDKIEVKGPQKTKIGRNSNELIVRPVVYNLVQNSAQIEEQITPEIVKTLVNDPQWPKYLKFRYPEFIRFIRALGKIDESLVLTREPTQKEYEAAIDEWVNELRSQLDPKNSTNLGVDRASQSNILEYFPIELVNLPVEVLVDMETGFVVAIRSTTIIKYPEEILVREPEEVLIQESDSSLKEILQDGIKITQEIYDIGYNDKVGQIPNVSGTIKPIKDMTSDFMATDLYSKLQFFIEGLFLTESTFLNSSERLDSDLSF